ncbi:MAG: carbohydrate ABC transporter substrate-binding protein [Cellulosilyticaceae bacterium]
MKKFNKMMTLALAVVVGSTGFVGCGQQEVPKDTTNPTTSNDTKKEDTKTDSKDKQTLKVAAIETAYGRTMWEEVAAAFEKVNSNVEVELVMDKSLEDVIGPAMKAGDFPDVIHLATGRPAGLTETFVKEENMIDMTDMLSMTIPGESGTVAEKLAGGFADNSITNPYNDGKTYLAPMFYGPCGLFYNAGLFAEKGWEVPTTWDEMWALGDKAKAEDIALFTYPTTGYFDAFFYALLNEVGGPEFFGRAMNYEEGIWQTPEATQAFEIVTKLASYTHPTTPANANNDNFQKNQQLILDNKALFMPNGNWVIGEMKDAPRAEGFEWGFTALPAITSGGDRYSYTFFEQAWIPGGAENADLAKEFIAFLYSDEAAAIFAKVGAIQPINGISDTLEGDMKVYYSIYDNGAKAAMGSFAATEPVEGVNIADDLFGTVNSIVTGDKTQEQWVNQVVKSSDALRGALK